MRIHGRRPGIVTMLLDRLSSVFAPSVQKDARRLVEAHGAGAVYFARLAVVAAEGTFSKSHWVRVLAKIEDR